MRAHLTENTLHASPLPRRRGGDIGFVVHPSGVTENHTPRGPHSGHTHKWTIPRQGGGKTPTKNHSSGKDGETTSNHTERGDYHLGSPSDIRLLEFSGAILAAMASGKKA
jgi:hypothetical protein